MLPFSPRPQYRVSGGQNHSLALERSLVQDSPVSVLFIVHGDKLNDGNEQHKLWLLLRSGAKWQQADSSHHAAFTPDSLGLQLFTQLACHMRSFVS